MKNSFNRDFGFLICEKISGKRANEIGIIDLKEKKITIQRTLVKNFIKILIFLSRVENRISIGF